MSAKPKSLFELVRLIVRSLAKSMAARAARGDRAKFERALARVPDVEPDERDRLSNLPE